jgi:hypothetical protein
MVRSGAVHVLVDPPTVYYPGVDVVLAIIGATYGKDSGTAVKSGGTPTLRNVVALFERLLDQIRPLFVGHKSLLSVDYPK